MSKKLDIINHADKEFSSFRFKKNTFSREETNTDTEETNTDIFDPPVKQSELGKISIFINKFREIYKKSIPIIVTSYLSRSILTGSLINLAFPDVISGFWQKKNSNVDLSLQIFMLIYILRNFRKKKDKKSSLMLSIISETYSYIDELTRISDTISNTKLQKLFDYIYSSDVTENLTSYMSNPNDDKFNPDGIIKAYMKSETPIYYEDYFTNDYLLPPPFKGGFNKNKIAKRKSKIIKMTKNINLTKKIKK